MLYNDCLLIPQTSTDLKMIKSSHPVATTVLIFALVITVFVSGCSERPVGYIFEPTQRHQSALAQTTVEVVNSLFEHCDEASSYLDRSSLTDDYISLLPGGWLEIPQVDSITGEDYLVYYFNYLDQKYYQLRFDREPMAGAVRTPSSLDYVFVEINSIQNSITNEFYGGINEIRNLTIEYSDDRQDPQFMDGWFEISRSIPFEEEIEIASGETISYDVYVTVIWDVRIERYSLDPDDHRARMVFEGLMPVYDEAGEYQRVHVSGELNINSSGKGGGDMWFYGEPSIRLHFTGRSYGFNGYFTTFDDDHQKIHNFE